MFGISPPLEIAPGTHSHVWHGSKTTLLFLLADAKRIGCHFQIRWLHYQAIQKAPITVSSRSYIMSEKDKGKHQRLFTTTTRGHGLKTASRICSFTQRSSSSSLYYRYLIYIKAKLRKYLQEIPSRLFTTDKIVNECFFSDWCISDLFSVNPDSCVIMNDFYDFEWRLWQVQVFFVSENGQSVSRIICFNVL